MGEWHKYKPCDSPCATCQMGWGSQSTYVDSTGELWIKSDSCSETCELLKGLLGNHKPTGIRRD